MLCPKPQVRYCRKISQQRIANNSQRNLQLKYIAKSIDKLNDNNINEIFNHINELNENNNSTTRKKRVELIKYINSLSDFQIEKTHSLLKTMVYPKGKNVGEILSPYLQKKAHEFIEAGLYK